MKNILWGICLLACLQSSINAAVKLKPTPLTQLNYEQPLLTGQYNESITSPETILGFPVGQRVASPEQIEKALLIWAKQSKRLQVTEYAKSHEGRALYAVYISIPENLSQIDSIRQDVQALANPTNLTSAQEQQIINRIPAISWMAYSIHGNESSGADAALAAIYHLIADKSASTQSLLENQIVIIDPMMNPDGRARFSKELEESRGVAPNIDNQSILHGGSWPYGRTNHYYFDLNRDFIFTTQPETKGRVALINQWYPQLMIDGHEMGSQDTFLFSPAREPINPHIAKSLKKWGDVFANDQAAAFDKKGWRYYTGEWFENFYAGYSNYSEYRGSVHILYEQARIAEDGVRRPEGRILTYKESVHHQFLSTLVNLETLNQHSKEMYKDFVKERRDAMSANGPYANISYAILPTNNHSRLNSFIETLQRQNIDVFQLKKNLSVSATDQFGIKHNSYNLPKGSVIIPNRQVEARLIAAMLEFDVPIKKEVLVEERQRNLRNGSSLMYDTTAWSLSMMHGLDALTVHKHINSDLEKVKLYSAKQFNPNPEMIAVAVQGSDDASVAFAARLLEQDVVVRVIDKETRLNEHSLPRGSIIITKNDQINFKSALSKIEKTAKNLNIELLSLTSGHGEKDLPDWGGRHFRLLTKPQIAILARGSFSAYDVGSLWHSIDSQLGIRHSQLNSLNFHYADLRRYNVLVLPHQYSSILSNNAYKVIDQWVKNGGTLIAIDGSIRHIMKQKMTRVKDVSNILEDSKKYDLSLHREWLAKNDELDLEKVNSQTVLDDLKYPWDSEVKRIKKDELKQRDKWQKIFMPAGAFVASRVDQKHWLSFGVNERLPLLFANNPVLMSDDSSQAVTRIGVLQDKKSGAFASLAKLVFGKQKAIGWSTLPEDHQLIVRMSGLLWPEAAQRIANAAHVTRESRGKGQVILFATQPSFRGSTKGTDRLFLNAIIYGPGLGARTTVNL